ncbi:MAG: MerR family transcriptional regulator [Candidatus Omnitrophica bacterium]|nr:MerR family transcriptional regulator [Candidatus Omnitrophota bacterium]
MLKKCRVKGNTTGKAIKVFPYGSEEWLRYEQVLEILTEASRKKLEELLNKKKEHNEQVNTILDEADRRIIHKAEKRRLKRYNLSQAAKILNVPRQTLYYWMKKGWVKPWRDYRRYPVFTVFDIQKIIKWRNTIELCKETVC